MTHFYNVKRTLMNNLLLVFLIIMTTAGCDTVTTDATKKEIPITVAPPVIVVAPVAPVVAPVAPVAPVVAPVAPVVAPVAPAAIEKKGPIKQASGKKKHKKYAGTKVPEKTPKK